MSQQLYVLEKTFEAEQDLSAKQYHFVELGTADNEVDAPDSAGDLAIGVLQNKPQANEAANVRLMGTAKVVCSATIVKGAWVGTASGGKAVTKSANYDIVRGIALEGADVNEIIEILLVCFTLSKT